MSGKVSYNGKMMPAWERRRLIAEEMKSALTRRCKVCGRNSNQTKAQIGDDGICSSCRGTVDHERAERLEEKSDQAYQNWGDF